MGQNIRVKSGGEVEKAKDEVGEWHFRPKDLDCSPAPIASGASWMSCKHASMWDHTQDSAALWIINKCIRRNIQKLEFASTPNLAFKSSTTYTAPSSTSAANDATHAPV